MRAFVVGLWIAVYGLVFGVLVQITTLVAGR